MGLASGTRDPGRRCMAWAVLGCSAAASRGATARRGCDFYQSKSFSTTSCASVESAVTTWGQNRKITAWGVGESQWRSFDFKSKLRYSPGLISTSTRLAVVPAGNASLRSRAWNRCGWPFRQGCGGRDLDAKLSDAESTGCRDRVLSTPMVAQAAWQRPPSSNKGDRGVVGRRAVRVTLPVTDAPAAGAHSASNARDASNNTPLRCRPLTTCRHSGGITLPHDDRKEIAHRLNGWHRSSRINRQAGLLAMRPGYDMFRFNL
jgi:hypothetical protein